MLHVLFPAGGRCPRSLSLFLSLLLPAVASCRASEPVQYVALRLDATHFAADPATVSRHHPVVQIGNEGREVVLAPERAWDHQQDDVSFEDGVARFEIKLPPGTTLSTHEEPQVSVLRVPNAPGLASKIRNWGGSWVHREDGWTLRSRSNDPSTLVVELEESPDDVDWSVSVRVEAYRRPPAEMESRPFELPPGAQMVLGYGWQWPHGSTAETLERAASLRCTRGGEIELFAESVPRDASDLLHWNEVTVSTEGASGQCTLRLVSRDGGGPVWATPRVLVEQTTSAGRADNVLVICLDTLAARHLPAYGYTRPTSPEIDRQLVQRGTLFASASTTFPRTDRAHIGLFSSLYAASYPHEPTYIGGGDAVTLMAESLRDAGFETVGVTEDGLIAGALGFWHGFDRYIERTTQGGNARATFGDAADYLRAHYDRRFFLFVHTYQVHAPWAVAPEYRALFRDDGDPVLRRVPKRFREKYDDYDRSIVETDALVGNLLQELDRLDLADRTLVVLLSDHGEAFGEHGPASHGFGGYGEEILIPLVFRGPGVAAGSRVDAAVSILDVAPTILDYLGLPPLPQAQGISLLAGLTGESVPADREIFFEWLGGNVGVQVGKLKLLDIRSRYKMYGLGVREAVDAPALLFDVAHDPDEADPVNGRGELRAPLEDAVERFREDTKRKGEELRRAGAESAPPPSVREPVIRALRALGYVE